MKKNQFESIAFSAAGILLAAVLVIGINILFSKVKLQADLTAAKVYTLSEGTRKVLAKLDTPVELRFYFSRNDEDMPVQVKEFAKRIEDLLAEYQKTNPRFIKVTKLDPAPDSDAEDSAELDGILGQQVSENNLYLGLAISCLDQKEAIPFINPDRESLMEYDITRAVSNVTRVEKPLIGVMSALPVMGGGEDPMMLMQMGRQPTPPWILVDELKKDYDVQSIPLTVDKIDEKIKVLVLLHPAGIKPETQYAIDQFVMRGGKLLALVDPFSYLQAQTQKNPNQMMMMMGASYSSNLDKLFPAWGITYNPAKVIADMEFATRPPSGARGETLAVVLEMNPEAFDPDDSATSDLKTLTIPFAGGLELNSVPGINSTVLVHSSAKSQLADAQPLQFGSFEQYAKKFKSGDKELPMAIRLTGKFKSAYPDGKPKAEANPEEPPKTEEKKEETLKESTGEPIVVVVGDSDFVYDQIALNIQEIAGQRFAVERNSNMSFFQNLVDLCAGDSNLLKIRSRAGVKRPFTVVQKIETEAAARYQGKLEELEQVAEETAKKINELQAGKQKDQQFILSAEQQKELKKFQEQEITNRKAQKEVRRELRSDIEKLETKIMWLNIGAIPILVTFAGVALAIVRAKRRNAR